MFVLQIQQRMEEMAKSGLNTSVLDDEAFNMEAAQDRCILRLIASCCNGEFLQLLDNNTEPALGFSFFYKLKLIF